MIQNGEVEPRNGNQPCSFAFEGKLLQYREEVCESQNGSSSPVVSSPASVLSSGGILSVMFKASLQYFIL
jgi:hypothetical protein